MSETKREWKYLERRCQQRNKSVTETRFGSGQGAVRGSREWHFW